MEVVTFTCYDDVKFLTAFANFHAINIERNDITVECSSQRYMQILSSLRLQDLECPCLVKWTRLVSIETE